MINNIVVCMPDKKKKKTTPFRKKDIPRFSNAKKALITASILGIGLGGKKIYDIYKKNLPLIEQRAAEKKNKEEQERLIQEQRRLEEKKIKEEQERLIQEEKQRIFKEQEKLLKQNSEEQKILEEKKKYLEELKIQSDKLLKQLRKTKKEGMPIDKLINRIQADNINNDILKTEVCRLYKLIMTKTIEECNKPYIENKQNCINRSIIKYGMDIKVVNKAISFLKC